MSLHAVDPSTGDLIKISGGTPENFYGECSTAAATAAKALSLTGFSLYTGVKVQIKFTNGHTLEATKNSSGVVTASYPTLNISSTGDKAIKVGAEYAGENFVTAGDTHEFIYDGTYWVDLTAVNIYENSTTARKRDGQVDYPSEYKFNNCTYIDELSRKFIYEGHSVSWTATRTGLLKVAVVKHVSGNTIWLSKNSQQIDVYSNFTDDTDHSVDVVDVSYTLTCYVKTGDVILIGADCPSSTSWGNTFLTQRANLISKTI